jgi:hypothetical protein
MAGPAPAAVIGLQGNMDFGSLPAGQIATRTLVITNGGTSPLNVWGITYPPAFTGNWSGTIAPAGSQTVQVTFSPVDQAAYGGILVVSNDAAPGSGSLPISGTGYFPLTNFWSIWWQHTNGTLALWSMFGTNALTKTQLNPASPGSGWRLAGPTEFNADNHIDLLFESSSGGVAAWLMNGNRRQTNSYLTPSTVDPTWQARGTADLNGDGGHNILWQRVDGSVAAWLMNGLTATQTVRLNPPQVDPGWSLAATGDFNGDSKSDILWQYTDGRVAVWFMNGTNRSSVGYLNPNSGWRLAGSFDFNADGHPGLIWEHASGALAYWQMAGTNLVHSGPLNPAAVDPAWRIAGASTQVTATIDTPTESALEAALAGGGICMFTCNGTLVLTNTIQIPHDTILDGNGHTVTISGGGAVRIFQVAAGVNFWLKGLTLSDGTVMAPNGVDGSPPSPGQDALGGAILCQGGNLTLTDCILSNNFVQGGHGGNETNPPPYMSGDGGMGAGGAIYASGGTLNLTNCSLLGSVAVGGLGGLPDSFGGSAYGGAIYMSNVTATLAQVTCASNRLWSGAAQAMGGSGANGGIALGGAICVSNSTILIANSSFFTNSAIAADPVSGGFGFWQSGSGIGGSLFLSQGSTATIQTSSFSNNVAQGGSGFLEVFAGPAMGGAVASHGSLLFTDCSISGNHTLPGIEMSYVSYDLAPGQSGRGGGVYVEGPTILNRCTFDNNQAIGGFDEGVHIYPGLGGVGEGGAIWSSGTLMATNCTCATNLALGGGGAANYLGPGLGGPGRGGGVYAEGPTTLNRCTFENNQAIGGFGEGISLSGRGLGGVGEGGAIWSSGTLMATNCTCATNLALGGVGAAHPYPMPGLGGPGRGGAIFTSAGGMLVNLTLAYNRADSQAVINCPAGPAQGGGLAVTNSPLTVRGTIIADSSNGGEVWGVVTDAGYNICSDGTAGFTATGSLTNTDPLLGPLADNGGLTLTIGLYVGSPALDRIPSGYPPTDQRGVSRPQGPAAEVGAYEGPGLPLPPALTISVSGSTVTISFNAQGGLNYELLSSTDLRTWVSIATNSIPSSGILSFVQAFSPGPSTFYRVVTP